MATIYALPYEDQAEHRKCCRTLKEPDKSITHIENLYYSKRPPVRVLLLICFFANTILACGGKGKMSITGEEKSSGQEITYRKSDYQDRWPFAVEEITVFCIEENLVYFKSNGKTYPLNGKAMSASERNFDSIWLNNPKSAGTKIPIPSEFIGNALDNCK